MKRPIRLASCLLAAALLAACATPQVAVVEQARPDTLFNDALFAPPAARVTADDVFALSPAMQQYVDEDIGKRIFTEGKVKALVDALYSNGKRKFNYDATITNNAAGVFAAHSGNCLSYTIMTAAFAKKLGLPVQFHAVTFGDVWDRSDNVDFRIGHVNLTVGPRNQVGTDPAQLIDFGAYEDVRGELLDDIGEDVIVAMYLNNRAAEALARNQLDDAYWLAREAAQHTPSYLVSYNTLGVIYQQHHNQAEANRVFQYVLDREPENVIAMSNQVATLKALGRVGESQALATRLAAIQPYPPFYYFNRGVRAMEQRDYQTAKEEFTKEVKRASYNHHFHFWLALADYHLGDMTESQRQLVYAMENSPNDEQHNIYAQKLALMKQKAASQTN